MRSPRRLQRLQLVRHRRRRRGNCCDDDDDERAPNSRTYRGGRTSDSPPLAPPLVLERKSGRTRSALFSENALNCFMIGFRTTRTRAAGIA